MPLPSPIAIGAKLTDAITMELEHLEICFYSNTKQLNSYHPMEWFHVLLIKRLFGAVRALECQIQSLQAEANLFKSLVRQDKDLLHTAARLPSSPNYHLSDNDEDDSDNSTGCPARRGKRKRTNSSN